jgi:DNA (cytosine-5)-methyltransferase 1
MADMGAARLLDAYCGAGGCSVGYHRAGFEVVGVDIRPQPRYPYEFHQADALAYIAEHGHEYDAIHASPPCQAFTALKSMWNAREHADLLTPTRDLLKSIGLPYVIENVPGAPMSNYITLCGTMFDLGSGDAELRRHRMFEIEPMPLFVPQCRHFWRKKVVGVYGGHGRDRRRIRPDTVGVYGSAGGSSVRDGTQQFSTDERREAMGIDWMTGQELSQAIPPAYTKWIGDRLMAVVEQRAALQVAS